MVWFGKTALVVWFIGRFEKRASKKAGEQKSGWEDRQAGGKA